jgi:xylulokinase
VKHLLGIDIGTTGAKTVVFDEVGTAVGTAFAPWPMAMPRPAWAEQDPHDWWTGVVTSVRDVLAASAIDPASIAGVGLSGQMHGLVLLDARREVLRPSIIWCDQRNDEECAWIEETVGAERLVRAVSNPALPGFTAPKLIWVRTTSPRCGSVHARCSCPRTTSGCASPARSPWR